GSPPHPQPLPVKGRGIRLAFVARCNGHQSREERMSYIAKPSAHHPALPKNTLGLTRRDYEGSMSTLCAGCGHDSITAALIEACFEMDLPAHRIAKVSGIGCSSKAPTY